MKKQIIETFLLCSLFLVLPVLAQAAPVITSVTAETTFAHGEVVNVSGSGFGSKTSQNGAQPVAFGDMENSSVSARLGAWSNTTNMETSTLYNRNANSTNNARCTLVDAGTGADSACYFSGGSDAAKWYTQHWFYLGPDFSWGGATGFANNKVFRLWSTGSTQSNLSLVGPRDRGLLSVEFVDSSHGGWGTGWQPTSSSYTCLDQAFGHACDSDYWDIYPAGLGWQNWATDMNKGTWHLWQFEYQASDIDVSNGILRWWIDGKPVFSHADIMTRSTAHPSNFRPYIIGMTAIHNNYGTGTENDGATGEYFLDDAYIDNTWQRIEIGNTANYNDCTLKEIQPATLWNDDGIIFNLNQGSFAAGSTGYLFITDENGTRNAGFTITFAPEVGDVTAPSAPSGLFVQ
ncbi:MAG: hypothetical protein HGA36_02885 [Candidatus Moranbacteria bacterium]|nr:hypothetical protein [Candidatus Moranbacteria bacterium]